MFPVLAYLAQYLTKYAKTGNISPELRHTLNAIVGVGHITHHEVGIAGGVMQSVLIGLSLLGITNKKNILGLLGNVEQDLFDGTRFADKLKTALTYDTVEDLAENVGVGSKADASWTTSAAVFLNTKKRSEAAPRMIELIKQGGDCDTTGAMFGALAGARWGVSVFPPEWRAEVEGGKELLKMADSLYNVMYDSLSAFAHA